MGAREVGLDEMRRIDWTRYKVGVSVEGSDEELGAIRFSPFALKFLRLCMTKELGNEIPAQVDASLGQFLEVITHMEQFLAERRR